MVLLYVKSFKLFQNKIYIISKLKKDKSQDIAQKQIEEEIDYQAEHSEFSSASNWES